MATKTIQIDRSKKKLSKSDLKLLNIASGGHRDRSNGLCVMEAVAWYAGKSHSDHPECVSPLIGGFMRRWNDNLPDDASRNKLLLPLIPVIVGTNVGKEAQDRRSWMALDWLIRIHLVAWLKLAKLETEAAAIEKLSELKDTVSFNAAMPAIRAAKEKSAAAWAAARDAAGDAAWAAARAAAGAAAWAAAWDAAGAAAWAAAWDAAGDAAWDAAGDAARAAAGAAAWAAARDAARDAARAAAGDALKTTTENLQLSAVELVKRMAAIGRKAA